MQALQNRDAMLDMLDLETDLGNQGEHMSWYCKRNGDYHYADEDGRFIATVSAFPPEYLASINFPSYIHLGSWVSLERAQAAIENFLEANRPEDRDPILFRKFGPISQV
jgi:hypothetical protein